MNDQIQSSIVIERTYRAEFHELWELWATKEGFESWWGPQDFRADVHMIEARLGGVLQLHYDMVADTPEAIAAMKGMGRRHRSRVVGRSPSSGRKNGWCLPRRSTSCQASNLMTAPCRSTSSR